MRRYEVRLEAQDGSGHFRTTRLVAEDKDAAADLCRADEFRRCAYRMPADKQNELLEAYDVDSIDDLPKPAAFDASREEKAAFRELETSHRALLTAHYQQQPYEVVSVDEITQREG